MLSFKGIQWVVPGAPGAIYFSKDVLRRVLVYTKKALLGGIGGWYILCVCMM